MIVDGSALPEVVRSGFRCTGRQKYRELLLDAMSQAEWITMDKRKELGKFVLHEFTWERMALRWHELFV